MIVLDTNVVSELMRPAPAAAVLTWMRASGERQLCTTAITVAEIRYGIERLPRGRRKSLLADLAAEVFAEFEQQVLPFDAAAARRYPGIVRSRERRGRPIDGFDAQIASICSEHGAALATRNGSDFAHTGVTVVDPWQARQG